MNSLTKLLSSAKIQFAMEAHNALSAIVVEQSGFPAIWASSFSISSSFGVRDRNEVSWTQMLDIVESMLEVTSIPILMDADSGYGDSKMVARFIRKATQRGICAVCIEDKEFPKANSFIPDKANRLTSVNDFCSKIEAAKAASLRSDLCLVARLEGLALGYSVNEALDRAGAYCNSGADAIIVHSISSDPSLIFDFSRQWNGPPLILIPTAYAHISAKEFHAANVKMLIWANQMIRSSISAMQKTCQRVLQEQSVCGVNQSIVSMEEVFHLQGWDQVTKELS